MINEKGKSSNLHSNIMYRLLAVLKVMYKSKHKSIQICFHVFIHQHVIKKKKNIYSWYMRPHFMNCNILFLGDKGL